ncbi:hypothetical protein [Streptomyces sp. NBC_01431]|uniref:hypothetical protein n=1 Tax=Streptomyces sp. NBC_01431 TaxID=2903863 RepID=UPI002E333C10|nr:hypothetical protein [Streptomyces sp. NBC_01431]
MDRADVLLELVGCLLHRIPSFEKSITSVGQVRRVGVLDQVDHVVELMALEIGLSEEADRPPEGEEARQRLRRLSGHVGDADLLAHALLVRQLRSRRL